MKNHILIIITTFILFSCEKDFNPEIPEEATKYLNSNYKINFFENINNEKSKGLTYPLTLRSGDNILRITCPPVMLDPEEAEACQSNGGGGGTNGSRCGSGLVTLKGRSGSFTGGVFQMNFTYSEDENGNTQVSGFRTSLTGSTFFNATLEQNGNPHLSYGADGETVTIEVDATVTRGWTYEGVGFTSTSEVTLKTTYNTCRGGGTGTIEEILEIANPLNQ